MEKIPFFTIFIRKGIFYIETLVQKIVVKLTFLVKIQFLQHKNVVQSKNTYIQGGPSYSIFSINHISNHSRNLNFAVSDLH
jgi:hypothetical protein